VGWIDLVRDRTRYRSRLEKLLEDALIKISSVASTLKTLSTRDMVEALTRGEHDPQTLADLARSRLRSKHAALVEALTGRFDDHHGELARILLDQIDSPPPPQDPTATDHAAVQDARQRLTGIPGISTESAQLIIAEIGLDMTRFPTPGHLVSWAKPCPRTIQSGTSLRAGGAGKGNPYLKGALGLAAAAAIRSKGTFLAERYHRLVKRRGKGKALVASGH